MNLINKKNMEENMNDMHGEETPRTDLTLFSEKMQELKSRIANRCHHTAEYFHLRGLE